MFAPIFCRGLSWRRSWQIGGSELAMGSLVPASGAGGLALGAWVLHEGGMDADRIARRSVAFFLIKSSVNFVAVAIIGLLMSCSLFGVDEPWTLTLLPALMSIAVIVAVMVIPRFGPGADPDPGASRSTRFIAASRRALINGTEGAIEIVRSGNVRVIAGAIGYWAFDNAVLWATFHAFGFSPAITIVLMGYLIGQLGGLLPIPGGDRRDRRRADRDADRLRSAGGRRRRRRARLPRDPLLAAAASPAASPSSASAATCPATASSRRARPPRERRLRAGPPPALRPTLRATSLPPMRSRLAVLLALVVVGLGRRRRPGVRPTPSAGSASS